MMTSMRRSVLGWIGLGLLALAAFALIIIDIGQSALGLGGRRGEAGEALATVGDQAVTEGEFVRRLLRAVEQERQRTPTLTQADFVRGGGAELVFEQLVAGKALERFGARHGVIASDRMVDGEIASIPAAQVAGRFDEATFRRLLAQQRLSEAEVRQGIAEDLVRRQLVAPVARGAYVPKAMAEAYAALLLEVREGELAVVPVEAMPDPGAPGEAALAAFWQANRRQFTVPERRGFRFARIAPDRLAEGVTVTPQEVEAFYRRNIARYGGEELREMNQVVLPSREEAARFVAEVRGGTPFAKAAAARGLTQRDIALGLTSRGVLAEDTSEGVAAAAFRTPAGQITNPVEGPLGFHVVEVVSIRPARPLPLRSVAAQIEKEIFDEKVQARVTDVINAAEDRLEAGEPLARIAADLGLAVEEVPPVTADGLRLTEDFELAFETRQLVDQAFGLEPGEGPQVVEEERGRFALIELGEVRPAETIPLAAIRDRVAAAWRADARRRAAETLARQMAEKASAGEPLDALARAARLPPVRRFSVRRLELTEAAGRGQAIPPPILMLLNTPAGQARAIPVPGGGAVAVVRTVRVTPGRLSDQPGLAEALRQSLARETALETSELFVRAVERAVGTVRRPEVLEGVKRRLAGVPADG